MTSHTPFFGELYLRSTRPFLGDRLSDREAGYLAHAFGSVAGLPPGPILDLGCGHGRHVARLQGRVAGGRPVVGIDFDRHSLRSREGAFPAVRGDLRALPFATRSAGGAYAWYSTLFVFDDPVQRAILAEVARVLRPGAPLILQTLPRERLERNPTSTWAGELPDGSRLEEQNRFDPDTGRDEGIRKLTTPDGRVLSAHYFIRYYRVAELQDLLSDAGFTVRWIHGGLGGEPVTAESADLIMGVERNG
ncbi:MAG: class I SAM-dependent methyltransferase [Myxococcaceae bacterium]|nr:class I SAM-dependent methyltransferase [Myxococcaceae bacterium]